MNTHNDNVIDLMNKVAELEQELAGMKHVAEAWKDKFMEHSRKLSRYSGAVEVEGIIHTISEDSIKNGISILSPISMKYNRQRVKVLVIPMEVE